MDQELKRGLKKQATRIKAEARDAAFRRAHGAPDAWHRQHRHLPTAEREQLCREMGQEALEKERAAQHQHNAAYVRGMAIVREGL